MSSATISLSPRQNANKVKVDVLQASIGDVRFRKLSVMGFQNRVAAAVLRIRQVRHREGCRVFGMRTPRYTADLSCHAVVGSCLACVRAGYRRFRIGGL